MGSGGGSVGEGVDVGYRLHLCGDCRDDFLVAVADYFGSVSVSFEVGYIGLRGFLLHVMEG